MSKSLRLIFSGVLCVLALAAMAGRAAAEDPKAPPKGGNPAPQQPPAGVPAIPPEIEKAFAECEDKYRRDLRSEKKSDRIEAVRAYAQTNHPTAVRRLKDQLEQKDPKKALADQEYRYSILRGLGRFTYPAAVKLVREIVLPMSKPEQVFESYLVFKGLAVSATPETMEVVLAGADGAKASLTQRAAAFEAIGDSHKQEWSDTIWTLLQQREPKWDYEEVIVALSAYEAFANCHKRSEDPKQRLPFLKELHHHIGFYVNDRVKFAAALCFAKVSRYGQATDDLAWLEWYMLQVEKGVVQADGKIKEAHAKGHKTDRMEFLGMTAVGRRIVFCIDLSDSMNIEVSPVVREAYEKARDEAKRQITGAKPAEEKEEATDEYDRMPVKTRLDIAKIELMRALDRLEKAEVKRQKELKDKKKGTKGGAEILSDPYKFNIVTYSTQSGLFDSNTPAFTPATKEEIKRYKDLVKKIEKGSDMTNIHGALLDALQVTTDGKSTEDPATSSKCILSGADTIFFLTDGWGSWSNDSVGKAYDKRISNPPSPAVGDGKFIYKEEIFTDYRRLNKFRKVVINTVGIDNHDRHLMSWLADDSGGAYVDLSGQPPIRKIPPPGAEDENPPAPPPPAPPAGGPGAPAGGGAGTPPGGKPPEKDAPPPKGEEPGKAGDKPPAPEKPKS